MGSEANQESTLADRGERRQLTALFYDIVGSTSFLERMDPEDFLRAQAEVHAEAAAAIERHGGAISQVHGDGGSAYFGYPTVMEDAAICAVRAALEIVESRKARVEVGSRVPLKVRVGIATGLVAVVRQPFQFDVVGLPVHLAARLQSEAEPGSVIVAQTTHELTRGAFKFAFIGTRRLKGLDEPQQLWRPEQELPAENRFHSLRLNKSPFLAREAEMSLLRRRWSSAVQSLGGSVIITGEPGIGKSRLADEFGTELVSSCTCERIILQCEPRGKATLLLPLLNALSWKFARQHSGGNFPQSVQQQLENFSPSIPRSSIEILAEYFGEARTPKHSVQSPQQSAIVRDELIEAAMHLIVGLARGLPLLLIIEDLHWADTFTETLALRLAQLARRSALLMIVTTRHPVSAEMNAAGFIDLSISRLPPAGVALLVSAVWHNRNPPDGLTRYIEQRSDGVPLFVEELARLTHARIVDSDAQQSDWASLIQPGGTTTIQDLAAVRLASLGSAKQIAQIASVLGREFMREHLTEVSRTAFPRDYVQADLDKLHRAGIIELVDDRGASFRFRHVLIQEAAYNSLLKSERCKLHDQIANLALTGRMHLTSDVLSWHLAMAGRTAEAVRFAIDAAEACSVRSAPREAYELLRRADNYLAYSFSDTNNGKENAQIRLRLLTAHATVATTLYGAGSEQARSAYLEGINFVREADDIDLETSFPLYWGWWFTAPDFRTQRSRSATIVEELNDVADTEIRLQSHHCAWATAFNTGRHEECLHHIVKGLDLYDERRAELSRTVYGGHDAKVCALGERAQSLWMLGRSGEAAASMLGCVRWASRTQHTGSMSHALDHALLLRYYQRRVRSVLSLCRRMQQLSEENNLPALMAKTQIFRGWALGRSSSLEAGLQLLEEGLALQRQTGTDEDSPVYCDMKAELLSKVGRSAEALEFLDDAIERFETTGHSFWLAELFRRRASIKSVVNAGSRAWESDLRRARAIANEQGAQKLLLRAEAVYAALDSR
jgi:class 3 adenylate cyclase/predicted ATPase